MPEPTVEVVTYIGRRGALRGILYAYLQADGDTMFTKKPLVAAMRVGDLVEIRRPGDDPAQYYSAGQHAPRVSGHEDHPRLLEWQVADRAAYQRKHDEDTYKRAAWKTDHLGHTIEDLARAASKLAASERAAFARYVSDRIRGI